MHSNRGMTLVEVVVALGIFSVTAGLIAGQLVFHLRQMGTNHSRAVAYVMAERELEDLRSAEYDAILPTQKEQQVGNLEYSIVTDVVDDSPGPHMKAITVSVGWNGPAGEQDVQVRTVYTEIKR